MQLQMILTHEVIRDYCDMPAWHTSWYILEREAEAMEIT
jgi:hypothetical protein